MTASAPGARPLLIVISSPSGGGKTTLATRLLAEHQDLVRSVSCTTRPRRGREQDGVDYYFLDEPVFAAHQAAGRFLEHAVVHGYKYGTLRQTVEEHLAAGRSVVLVIDVQGAAQVRRMAETAPAGSALQRGYVDVFLVPPTMEVLRARLVGRGEDSAATVERRMQNAEMELRRAGEYRHVLVNDDLDGTYQKLKDIVAKEKARHG